MIADEFTQLERNPEWRLLLTAYRARQLGAEDGWVDRITELPPLASDQLPRIHGRLIALGLLEFELGGRSDGMRYQLSPLGRQALHSPAEPEAETLSLSGSDRGEMPGRSLTY